MVGGCTAITWTLASPSGTLYVIVSRAAAGEGPADWAVRSQYLVLVIRGGFLGDRGYPERGNDAILERQSDHVASERGWFPGVTFATSPPSLGRDPILASVVLSNGMLWPGENRPRSRGVSRSPLCSIGPAVAGCACIPGGWLSEQRSRC